jgi:hypothetical protein
MRPIGSPTNVIDLIRYRKVSVFQSVTLETASLFYIIAGIFEKNNLFNQKSSLSEV